MLTIENINKATQKLRELKIDYDTETFECIQCKKRRSLWRFNWRDFICLDCDVNYLFPVKKWWLEKRK